MIICFLNKYFLSITSETLDLYNPCENTITHQLSNTWKALGLICREPTLCRTIVPAFHFQQEVLNKHLENDPS